MLPLTGPDAVSNTSNVIKEGDLVIVYENANNMKAIVVDSKARYDSKFGSFIQKLWVGKDFGSKVCAQSGSRGYVHLLRPSPELWTQVLRHRTQILYVADISLICLYLELRPGSVVLESGTGSGSLTHSLIRAVAPIGHVHTFEFHQGRAEDAAKEFKEHGLGDLVTVTHRNIEELGFPTEYLAGKADALFLDLPAPYKVVENAATVLKPNGRFCSFSPCIEQIQRTRDALAVNGFVDIECYEVLLRTHEVHTEHLDLMTPDAFGAEAQARPRVIVANTKAPEEPVAAAAPAAEDEEEIVEPAAKKARVDGEADAEVHTGADAGLPVAEEPVERAAGENGEPRVVVAARVVAGGESKAVMMKPCRRWVPFVTTKPSVEARGHTGYLLFARKFV